MRDLPSESLLTILRNPTADLYGHCKSNTHRPDNCVEGKRTDGLSAETPPPDADNVDEVTESALRVHDVGPTTGKQQVLPERDDGSR